MDAINKLLEVNGIDIHSRELVMSCITSTSMSLLMFAIAIDSLSKLTGQYVEDRELELYTSGNILIESRLACFDDISFFCCASSIRLEPNEP